MQGAENRRRAGGAEAGRLVSTETCTIIQAIEDRGLVQWVEMVVVKSREIQGVF